MQTIALNSVVAGPSSEAPPAVGKPIEHGARIWSGFALALASMVLVGAIGIRTTHALIDRDAWVTHTLIVIDRLGALDSTSISLEGNLLGYAASGKESFLHLAEVETAALDGEVDRIRKLVVDNPNQSRRVANLGVLLGARRGLTKGTLAIARAGDLSAAAARILHGPELALSYEIAQQVAEISAVEHALLAARDAAAAAAGRESLALIAFGSLFAVFFVGLAGLFIARSLEVLRLRNQQLAESTRHMRELNHDLDEQRAAAEQRARDLAASEEALQRQTDLLQTILESMAEGVLARANDGRLLLSNAAARRMLPGGPVDPESDFDTFMSDYAILDEFGTLVPLAETPLWHALGGHPSDGGELYLRRLSTGEICCVGISARPLRDRRGVLFGAMVVFREIDERKRSEREQAQLAALVHSSSDAIVSGTPAGVIATFSPGAERLYG